MLFTAIFIFWLIPSTAILQFHSAAWQSEIIEEIKQRLIAKSRGVALLNGPPKHESIASPRRLEIGTRPDLQPLEEPYAYCDDPKHAQAMVSDLPVVFSIWFSKDRELTPEEIICMSSLPSLPLLLPGTHQGWLDIAGPCVLFQIFWNVAMGTRYRGIVFVIVLAVVLSLVYTYFPRPQQLPQEAMNNQNMPPANDEDIIEPNIPETASGNAEQPSIDEGQPGEDGAPNDENEPDEMPNNDPPPDFIFELQLDDYLEMDDLD